ncbi:hypothetical protein GCM10009639_14600 [Kitasatospora putterlickiae]|uniref:Uncharacterized protein n=1 Tax=Kitasatospora putterlickiae TaxID=221725 RepID=A0ABN1XRL8_9ACTN
MNPPAPIESGCEMMKRAAKDLKKEIEHNVRRAAEMRSKITALQGQANPDQAQISALKQALEVLEKKIEEDRVSLSTLEDVITENC